MYKSRTILQDLIFKKDIEKGFSRQGLWEPAGRFNVQVFASGFLSEDLFKVVH